MKRCYDILEIVNELLILHDDIYLGKDSIVGKFEPCQKGIFGHIAAIIVCIDSILNPS